MTNIYAIAEDIRVYLLKLKRDKDGQLSWELASESDKIFRIARAKYNYYEKTYGLSRNEIMQKVSEEMGISNLGSRKMKTWIIPYREGDL